MNAIVHSTWSDGMCPKVGDRPFDRDEAIARGVAAGYPAELVRAVVKRYRAV